MIALLLYIRTQYNKECLPVECDANKQDGRLCGYGIIFLPTEYILLKIGVILMENDNILGYRIIRTYGKEDIVSNIEKMIDELLILSGEGNG